MKVAKTISLDMEVLQKLEQIDEMISKVINAILVKYFADKEKGEFEI